MANAGGYDWGAMEKMKKILRGSPLLFAFVLTRAFGHYHSQWARWGPLLMGMALGCLIVAVMKWKWRRNGHSFNNSNLSLRQ
jgi:hypothetical protein